MSSPTQTLRYEDRASLTFSKRGKTTIQEPVLGVGDEVVYRELVTWRNGEYRVKFKRLELLTIDETETWATMASSGVKENYHYPSVVEGVNNETVWNWCRPEEMSLQEDEWKGFQETDLTYVPVPEPPSAPSLTFSSVTGEGARARVNWFLNGGRDGRVDHNLGGVTKWLAAFEGRYYNVPISMLVLDRHPNPECDTGSEVVVSRLANHPNRPANTSSWMLARAREWAAEAGYDEMIAFAGVGHNEGTCYEAAGFDRVGEPVTVSGTESDRAVAPSGEWTRTKWSYAL
jgi:hypothetical protein